MKVLVTGAKGFLGNATTVALRTSGHEVVATGKKTGGELIGCDLTVPSGIEVLLKKCRPDAIINCAAEVDFGDGVLNKLYPINALAPAVMCLWAAANGAYFVQVSSVAVQGVRSRFIDEFTPIDPDTDYGLSKWLAEEMVRASGAECSVVRFCGIFGVGGAKHLGINKAINNARIGVAPTIRGGGAAKRNYIHISDAAAALEACVGNRLNGVQWAAGREVNSIAEILDTLCEVYELEGPLSEEGQEGIDQVVKSSKALPLGKTLSEALVSEL